MTFGIGDEINCICVGGLLKAHMEEDLSNVGLLGSILILTILVSNKTRTFCIFSCFFFSLFFVVPGVD